MKLALIMIFWENLKDFILHGGAFGALRYLGRLLLLFGQQQWVIFWRWITFKNKALWLLIGLVCARIAGSQLRTFYFFVQWLKMFGNLFFIWGIKGYAEDCTTDAIVLARKILLSQEFKIWKAVLLFVLWTIWLERNCKTFDGVGCPNALVKFLSSFY